MGAKKKNEGELARERVVEGTRKRLVCGMAEMEVRMYSEFVSSEELKKKKRGRKR